MSGMRLSPDDAANRAVADETSGEARGDAPEGAVGGEVLEGAVGGSPNRGEGDIARRPSGSFYHGRVAPGTPGFIIASDRSDPLTPDTEEHVCDETEAVFRDFVVQMHERDMQRSQSPLEDSNMAEITFTGGCNNPLTSEIGRHLAEVGDDINSRYASEFTSMLVRLNVNSDTAYEAFAGIARKVFYGGKISWGRVITLLCFGYQMAINVVRKGIKGFFAKIVSYLCRFLLVEKIAQWIADQGGWRSVLNLVPENASWESIAFVSTAAFVSVLAVYFLRMR